MKLFELFLTKEILNLLVNETRKYTLFETYNDSNITSNEIWWFIVTLLLSGLYQVQ